MNPLGIPRMIPTPHDRDDRSLGAESEHRRRAHGLGQRADDQGRRRPGAADESRRESAFIGPPAPATGSSSIPAVTGPKPRDCSSQIGNPPPPGAVAPSAKGRDLSATHRWSRVGTGQRRARQRRALLPARGLENQPTRLFGLVPMGKVAAAIKPVKARVGKELLGTLGLARKADEVATAPTNHDRTPRAVSRHARRKRTVDQRTQSLVE